MQITALRRLVPQARLERALSCLNQILSLARLPVPPLGHIAKSAAERGTIVEMVSTSTGGGRQSVQCCLAPFKWLPRSSRFRLTVHQPHDIGHDVVQLEILRCINGSDTECLEGLSVLRWDNAANDDRDLTGTLVA